MSEFDIFCAPDSHLPHIGGNRQSFDWAIAYARYIRSKAWHESLVDPKGEQYGLPKTPGEYRIIQEEKFSRTIRFMEFLGRPQDAFHSVHIAGTGGKGSTTTMIEVLLRKSGVRTGLHVSPYFQIPNESLVINGVMASPSDYSQSVDRLKGLREAYMQEYPDNQPFYGEIRTALTFGYFRDKKIECAVVETGMGGRYDPTNVLPSDVSVITNVDMDHVTQLGPTLEDIAWHKAGIIKENRVVILGETKPPALTILKKEAQAKQCEVFTYGEDFGVTKVKSTSGGITADITTPFLQISDLFVNLPGEYQAKNAATAIMAVLVTARKNNLAVTRNDIKDALANIELIGRMEKMQENPPVIIDGAHNPQKMEAATGALVGMYPHHRRVAVLGVLRTKDAREILKHVLPVVDLLITSEPHVSGKPALPAEELAEIARTLAPDRSIYSKGNVEDAVKAALLSADNRPIFVSGSIYMLQEVRSMWHPVEDILKGLEYNYRN